MGTVTLRAVANYDGRQDNEGGYLSLSIRDRVAIFKGLTHNSKASSMQGERMAPAAHRIYQRGFLTKWKLRAPKGGTENAPEVQSIFGQAERRM